MGDKTNTDNFSETKLLKLNCDKALSLINWEPSLTFETTMRLTSEWYFSFYNKKDSNIFDKCCQQIKDFNSNKKLNKIMNPHNSLIVIKKLKNFN